MTQVFTKIYQRKKLNYIHLTSGTSRNSNSNVSIKINSAFCMLVYIFILSISWSEVNKWFSLRCISHNSWLFIEQLEEKFLLS